MITDSPNGDSWDSMTQSGLTGSFLRVPHVPPESAQVQGAGIAIYGMPWDSMQLPLDRSGANYGPRGIRELSSQSLSYNARWDFDLINVLSPVDCGDCKVVIGNPERTFKRAQNDLEQIIIGGAIPVVLGGDHSVTIPAVRAVQAQTVEDIGLVLIDTHMDTSLDIDGEELTNCSPIARAIDSGFNPESTVLIGINGWLNPRDQLQYCRDLGITVIWLEDVWERGVASVVEQVEGIVGKNGLYLTVDIDGLDGAFAPGTGTPSPGGLTSREMLEFVRGIARFGLVGLDVVETAPTLDATGATAGMAVRIILDALAAHAGAIDPESQHAAP